MSTVNVLFYARKKMRENGNYSVCFNLFSSNHNCQDGT